mmetsp:Transcript_6060/g.10513  ORF Transcript_6060/g.10513 Transcript_6060/m.10513 type:complete len:484 (-) Transcript_6060:612-2063(-)
MQPITSTTSPPSPHQHPLSRPPSRAAKRPPAPSLEAVDGLQQHAALLHRVHGLEANEGELEARLVVVRLLLDAQLRDKVLEVRRGKGRLVSHVVALALQLLQLVRRLVQDHLCLVIESAHPVLSAGLDEPRAEHVAVLAAVVLLVALLAAPLLVEALRHLLLAVVVGAGGVPGPVVVAHVREHGLDLGVVGLLPGADARDVLDHAQLGAVLHLGDPAAAAGARGGQRARLLRGPALLRPPGVQRVALGEVRVDHHHRGVQGGQRDAAVVAGPQALEGHHGAVLPLGLGQRALPPHRQPHLRPRPVHQRQVALLELLAALLLGDDGAELARALHHGDQVHHPRVRREGGDVHKAELVLLDAGLVQRALHHRLGAEGDLVVVLDGRVLLVRHLQPPPGEAEHFALLQALVEAVAVLLEHGGADLGALGVQEVHAGQVALPARVRPPPDVRPLRHPRLDRPPVLVRIEACNGLVLGVGILPGYRPS